MTAAIGGLIVVATPIGNLGDLSPRAVASLRQADVIACEDTRHTRKLLTHAGIQGPTLLAVHGHNEAAQVGEVLRLLERGLTVALVSDAGTPLVSDPGQRLVAAVAAAGHRVEAVPGPSAAVAALVVSGLPAERWCFEGFLPVRGRDRRARLGAVAGDERTTVIFEAPHRVIATLADLASACGPLRPVAVARELTKLHEEVWRGTLADAQEHVGATGPRGEYVVVVGGAPPAADASDAELLDDLRGRLASGTTARDAVTETAQALGVGRRRVYALALQLRGEG